MFVRYRASNEAKWQLLTTISAGATSLVLKSWQWGLFPSVYPYKLKLEK